MIIIKHWTDKNKQPSTTYFHICTCDVVWGADQVSEGPKAYLKMYYPFHKNIKTILNDQIISSKYPSPENNFMKMLKILLKIIYCTVTGPDCNSKSMFTLMDIAKVMKCYQIKVTIRHKFNILLSKTKIPENLNLKSQFYNILIWKLLISIYGNKSI